MIMLFICNRSVACTASDRFFVLRGGVMMSEQSAHHQTGKDEAEQQNDNYQKGETYEYNRQNRSGILRSRQRI